MTGGRGFVAGACYERSEVKAPCIPTEANIEVNNLAASAEDLTLHTYQTKPCSANRCPALAQIRTDPACIVNFE